MFFWVKLISSRLEKFRAFTNYKLKISTDEAWKNILDFQDIVQLGSIKKRSIVERDIFLQMVHKRVAKEVSGDDSCRKEKILETEAIRFSITSMVSM